MGHVDSTYQALESVLLQHYFGIQEFFLYDNGLTHKAMGALSQATKRFSNLNVAVLPWNLPLPLEKSTIDHIVTNDCHFRARNRGFTGIFLLIFNLTRLKTRL